MHPDENTTTSVAEESIPALMDGLIRTLISEAQAAAGNYDGGEKVRNLAAALSDAVNARVNL